MVGMPLYPQAPGLYFYYFTIDTWNGSLSLQKARYGPGGQSTLEHTGLLWQLTVYEKGFTTPDWLAGGILYQIFPDRFFSSGTPKESPPWGRTMHASWKRRNPNGNPMNREKFPTPIISAATSAVSGKSSPTYTR